MFFAYEEKMKHCQQMNAKRFHHIFCANAVWTQDVYPVNYSCGLENHPRVWKELLGQGFVGGFFETMVTSHFLPSFNKLPQIIWSVCWSAKKICIIIDRPCLSVGRVTMIEWLRPENFGWKTEGLYINQPKDLLQCFQQNDEDPPIGNREIVHDLSVFISSYFTLLLTEPGAHLV